MNLKLGLVFGALFTLTLLAQRNSPTLTNTDSTTALMSAVLMGDSQDVEALLKRGSDPNEPGPAGATALMWAIPDVEKARILIAHGANVNARSEGDHTSLLVAAGSPGTVDVLKLLLDHGADLHAKDKTGADALSLAVRFSDIDVVRFLAERGLELVPGARRGGLGRYDLPITEYVMSKGTAGIQDVLVTAAAWQPVSLLNRWLESGADVNASSSFQYGRTPLLSAITSEGASIETVKLLLDHGADPNARMTEGETPLDWAIYKGDQAEIELLQQHQAKRGNGPRQREFPAPEKGTSIPDSRTALSKSLPQLLAAAQGFHDGQKLGCISCHNNAMPALAAAAARRKGIEIDKDRAGKNVDYIFTYFKTTGPRMILGEFLGGEQLTAGYSQMALAANGHPLDTTTATITHWLLEHQMPDGRWLGNGMNRPPSEYSTISHTAIAVGGLKAYPIPARQKEIDRSIQRAQKWLLSATPQSAEERAMRLMGLVWAGATKDQIAGAIKDVRDRQETGGGWSQFGRTAPDAYATGESLYALHLAGTSVKDEAYRKGIAFLLGTQYPDGTWLVKTHAFPQQRQFESGFPFGFNQWISSAGTSWAALAIAQTLPAPADAKRRIP